MIWSVQLFMLGRARIDLRGGCLGCLVELDHMHSDPARERLTATRLPTPEARWWFGHEEFGEGEYRFFPLWPLALSAALGGWAVARSTPRTNQCRRCRYDLSGLGEGSVCPECGSKL